MKTYLADIIPRLQRFSKKLDDLAKLSNQHWVAIDDIAENKTVYIFRSNNELLISKNGSVERAKWEYLDNQSILIDVKGNTFLLRHGFLDENVLALKMDSSNKYAFFVNENKFEKELTDIYSIMQFLNFKYLKGAYILRPTVENSRKVALKIQTPIDERAALLVNSNASIADLSNVILNWAVLCFLYSDDLPLYAYIELVNRSSTSITVNMKFSLNEYARWRGFDSFDIMKNKLITYQ